MDIANANKFTYGPVTLKQLTEALSSAYAKTTKPRVLFLNEKAHRMMQEAIMDQWEISQKVLTPCPNCKKMAEDGCCPYCDYPYNRK